MATITIDDFILLDRSELFLLEVSQIPRICLEKEVLRLATTPGDFPAWPKQRGTGSYQFPQCRTSPIVHYFAWHRSKIPSSLPISSSIPVVKTTAIGPEPVAPSLVRTLRGKGCKDGPRLFPRTCRLIDRSWSPEKCFSAYFEFIRMMAHRKRSHLVILSVGMLIQPYRTKAGG
jgi:hypothetical protein